MTRQPTELRLPRPIVARPAAAPRSSAALDEAFATVTDADLRLDKPATENGLADGLREQLAALEKQQRELSRLLDGLGG